MSESKKQICPMAAYYPDLFELDGVMMDAASYERHKNSKPHMAEPQTAAPTAQREETDALDDVFSAPQDLRQLTADVIRADEARRTNTAQPEYRPDTALFLPGSAGTEDVYVLPAASDTWSGSGSGSYRGSGSYVPGSFAGSFPLSSSGLGGYGLELI